jgi:hypothetical protein
MVLPLAALAQTPPVLYRCTVYQDGVLAGAGKVVTAYVGTETAARAQATTNASGVAILSVSVTPDDFGPPAKAISFRVNDVTATETPNVNITQAAPSVRLDVSVAPAFDPWDYDDNPDDGVISKAEALAAVNDYFDGIITKDQALQVVNLYFD